MKWTMKKKKKKKLPTKQISFKRILIMDDEEMILNITEKLFKKLGFFVAVSKNGEEMLNIYKNAMKKGEKFDIVLIDLTIHGGMGGEEAVKKLLELDKDAVAVVSSGYSNSPIMANFKDYGFKACLIKPYKIDDIKNLINEISNN